MVQLTDLTDIINLDIKDPSCLTSRKNVDWVKIEKRVKQKYKAPSLSACLLYEHNFNDKPLMYLSSKLGISQGTLKNAMCTLGIPLIDYRKFNLGRPKRNYEQDYSYLMRRYWKNKWSLEKIAEEQGVTRQAIHQRMEACGVETRSRPHTKRPSKKQLYRMYYQENKTTPKIAEELEVYHTTVGTWLREYKIPLKSWSKISEKEIRESYTRNNMTVKEIAQKYKVCSNTVSKTVKRFSLPLRVPSRARKNAYNFKF